MVEPSVFLQRRQHLPEGLVPVEDTHSPSKITFFIEACIGPIPVLRGNLNFSSVKALLIKWIMFPSLKKKSVSVLHKQAAEEKSSEKNFQLGAEDANQPLHAHPVSSCNFKNCRMFRSANAPHHVSVGVGEM
jgi:hypothetical protein